MQEKTAKSVSSQGHMLQFMGVAFNGATKEYEDVGSVFVNSNYVVLSTEPVEDHTHTVLSAPEGVHHLYTRETPEQILAAFDLSCHKEA